MEPPMRSATAIWHNDTYSGISPERLELNANGKHVVITGAVSIYRPLSGTKTMGAKRFGLLNLIVILGKWNRKRNCDCIC